MAHYFFTKLEVEIRENIRLLGHNLRPSSKLMLLLEGARRVEGLARIAGVEYPVRDFLGKEDIDIDRIHPDHRQYSAGLIASMHWKKMHRITLVLIDSLLECLQSSFQQQMKSKAGA